MKRLWVIFLVGFINGCTDSHFTGTDDKAGNDGTVLTGKVLLSGEDSHENTYVYLTGFDISSRTDSTGRFSLEIPAGGVSTISGSFALYFYNATFRYDSVIVEMINGQVPFPQKDFSADGSLKQNRKLTPFLELSTTVFPSVIMIKDEIFRTKESGIGYDVFNNLDTANMIITARFLQGSDGVSLRIPLTENDKISFGIILQANSKAADRVIDNGFSHWEDFFGGTGKSYTNVFQFPITSYLEKAVPTNISKGKYYMLPNLLIQQPGLPSSLISSLISCPMDRYPTADYLKLPIRYSSIGSFEVREGVVIYE